MPQTLQLARHGRQVTLTLHRPPLNILDMATIEALGGALEQLTAQPDLAVVVIEGAGGKGFSAGVAVEDHTLDRVGPMLRSFHAALAQLFALEAVTVAAVDGHCLGGGMELAMMCDVVVATERSRFGQPEIKLGCYPPVAAALYPAIIGQARTVEMLTTGRIFDAQEAARLGLVTEVVASTDQLAERVAARVAALLALSTPVLRLTKRAIRRADAGHFAAALAAAEHIYLTDLVALDDLVEGTEAFLAKRSPAWRQR